MNITLPPAQVTLIQQQIHAGQFETVNQAIEAALQLLDKQMQGKIEVLRDRNSATIGPSPVH